MLISGANFFQKWKDFCVEFLHIWIQIFPILKFNLKRNSKIEKIQIYHFLSSLLSFHSFVCTCTIIACKIWCFFVAYLIEFSNKIGKFDFFAKYSTNVLFYCHFDYQGTLFPSKIFKNISKIWELNFKLFWKSLIKKKLLNLSRS